MMLKSSKPHTARQPQGSGDVRVPSRASHRVPCTLYPMPCTCTPCPVPCMVPSNTE